MKTLFHSCNLGCKTAVVQGINWFFKHVSCGIILEDDCALDPNFMFFAQYYLDYYRSDTRVWNICASNFQNGRVRGEFSLYFSKYMHCWGCYEETKMLYT